MRLIVFFDLPMQTNKDLTEYRNFRTFLIKNGFIMLQKSVYSRLVLTPSSADLVKKQINKNLPKNGLIQLMQVTEKQYASMEYLIGKGSSNVINSNERIIEL
jgi:CRISPR-associated protein Cas2